MRAIERTTLKSAIRYTSIHSIFRPLVNDERPIPFLSRLIVLTCILYRVSSAAWRRKQRPLRPIHVPELDRPYDQTAY